MTTAENLKHLLEAHAALLNQSTGEQYKLAKDLTSCEDKLNAMRVNIDRSQTQGPGAPILMYGSQNMHDKIKSEIVMVREIWRRGTPT